VHHGTIIGTYVHGPLLPKNPWLADWLIAAALRRGGDERALEPLDDELELAAHRAAAAIA
jgi:CobQ-like glutamine amidotransferase family enzyme